MTTNKLPRSCIDEIQGLQRRFVWGDTDDKRKIHVVAWDTVTLKDLHVLRSKYKIYNSNDYLNKKVDASSLWQDIVAAIPVMLKTGRWQDGRQELAGTRNNEFSIKEMFKEIEGYKFKNADGDWNKIWKALVPKRCKSFLWILKHDRLLTNFSKSKKGLGSAVWKSLVPSDILVDFFRVDQVKS
ncbi:unnamed protein product [Vicia faba]|uniref:Reverse transcriptase zinc-binding domain-containing protein n=1 Tax=Vicia faba TaxID=3906 RepID=A0AAV0YD86_VICFA|nr:unnamed protein product [Vicia faba]